MGAQGAVLADHAVGGELLRVQLLGHDGRDGTGGHHVPQGPGYVTEGGDVARRDLPYQVADVVAEGPHALSHSLSNVGLKQLGHL